MCSEIACVLQSKSKKETKMSICAAGEECYKVLRTIVSISLATRRPHYKGGVRSGEVGWGAGVGIGILR